MEIQTPAEELTYVTYKKPKKKKPLTEQRLKERLRKRCVEKAKTIAKDIAGWRCQYVDENDVRCRSSKETGQQMHGSHIYSEGKNVSMSADVDNILCFCNTHHMTGKYVRANKDFNWHGQPAEAMDWFIGHYPELYSKLRERTRISRVCDMQYWKNKLEELKNIK